MNTLEFGDFTLDPAGRQLLKSGQPVLVPAKAFDLLVYMASNAGRLLPKNELLQAVWPDAFVEEANLTQNVSLLRKAMSPTGETYITTIPGRGYQFVAQVKERQETALSHPAATPAILASERPSDLSPPSRREIATHSRLTVQEEIDEGIDFRSPWSVAILTLLAASLCVAGWLGWKRWEDRVGGPPVQVVLADFEGGTGDAVLDRTLSEAVRIDLAQSPFVGVLSAGNVRRTLAQMLRKPDDVFTPALAREVCERTGSQAVLSGNVARTGDHYLIALEATNCVDGAALAGARAEAKSRNDIPGALDKISGALRHDLGESRRTIARFSSPLISANTGSIEALEDLTQAHALSQRGKLPDAITLLRHAVELDPNFAQAYLDLANFSASVGDKENERTYIQRAYDLRSNATEPARLYIVAHYNDAITGDLYASLRNYTAWTELYPRDVIPWVGLSQIHRTLGRHSEAVADGEHALALNSHISGIYYQLALEQMHAGQPAAARATCELAAQRGIDSELTHNVLLKVAYLTHDTALFSTQQAWASLHPEAAHMLLTEASIAIAEGRDADAKTALASATESLRQQGLDKAVPGYEKEFVRGFALIGDIAEARLLLAVSPVDAEQPEEIAALAAAGSSTTAESLLQQQLLKRPTSTIWQKVEGPKIRAVIALSRNNPRQAIDALEAARGFEATSLDIYGLRAQAYLAAHQPALADAEFRLLLSHPEIEPDSAYLSFSELDLARTLREQGNSVEAREHYRQFLERFRNSNGQSTLSAEARLELQSLDRK